jgi:uncharacterized phage protein gp47/JayE
MSDYGLKTEGFVRKPLDVMLSELQAGFESIFGSNVDTDPDSPDGQEIGLFSGALDEAWQTIAEGVTALDPDNAEGVLQSSMVKLNGITRNDEEFTSVVADVVGVVPNVLLAGAVAETSDTGDRFVLSADVTFTGGADSSVWIAESAGPVPCEAATLTVISTPKPGWTSITNPAAATSIGALEEEDGDLRIRRDQSSTLGAVHAYEAITAGMLNVLGVLDAKLLVNETGSVDGDGLPAHSIRMIVEGGTDDDVAQSFWDEGTAGVERTGTSSGTASDRNGNSQTVPFSRPVDVNIWIEMTLATGPGFPADGADQIKQAIVDYAAGIHESQIGNPDDDGYQIAEDVIYSRLYIPINSVPGHSVTDLTLGIAASPVGKVDVPITNLQKSRFAIARITVS